MTTQGNFNDVKVQWLVTGDTHADFSRFYAVQQEAEKLDIYYKIIVLAMANNLKYYWSTYGFKHSGNWQGIYY